MSIEWEIEELACAACCKSEEEAGQAINDGTTDEILYERYGVDFETYTKIVKDLLPFTPIVQSALAQKNYHAFVADNRMIVRQECA
ncbi:MAG: hypothetical protein Q8N96_02340 [Methylovulum sp.]|nr:hypothetical protein [Methylovulum sp.]